MATQGAKGSGGPQKVNNNGGTVVGGGDFDPTGPISNDLKIRDLGFDGVYGSQIVESVATSDDTTDPDGLITANPNSAGGLAHQEDRNIIAIGLDSTINGEASNLQTPASDYAGVPRYKRNVVTGSTKLGKRQWLYPALPGPERVPGKVLDPNEGQAYDFASTTASGDAGVDQATERDRKFPGELTFRFGAPLPVTRDLRAHDSSES